MTKPHYFDQEAPDEDDHLLKMAISQGYVPEGCLLNGPIVMGLVQQNEDPCSGCECSRYKCGGRPHERNKGQGINPNEYRYDKSKKGCVDNLCLVDLSPGEMSIFIIDLVWNVVTFSKTYQAPLGDMVYMAVNVALKHKCTRIVFDYNPVQLAMIDKQIKEMDVFPFTSVPESEKQLFEKVP